MKFVSVIYYYVTTTILQHNFLSKNKYYRLIQPVSSDNNHALEKQIEFYVSLSLLVHCKWTDKGRGQRKDKFPT